MCSYQVRQGNALTSKSKEIYSQFPWAYMTLVKWVPKKLKTSLTSKVSWHFIKTTIAFSLDQRDEIGALKKHPTMFPTHL